MSKASEYAKRYHEIETAFDELESPRIILRKGKDGRNAVAGADGEGGIAQMYIHIWEGKCLASVELLPEEALALAAWIVATFGEEQ